MNEVLQDLSPPALVTAIEENFILFFRALFRYFPQAEVHAGPDLQWWITDVPEPIYLNGIIGARLAPDGVDAAIEAAIARGKSRGLPQLWFTGPADRPANLGARLEAHRFTHLGDAPGMAADLLALNDDPPKPSGQVIKQVVDANTLKEWCHTFVTGFGYPAPTDKRFFESAWGQGLSAQSPFRHYIGWLEGEPVATSRLFLGAGVGGIHDVATVPEARRKGIGAAMTLAPCRDALTLGYRAAILGASEMGFGVYQKIGFQKYCEFGLYLWKPAIG